MGIDWSGRFSKMVDKTTLEEVEKTQREALSAPLKHDAGELAERRSTEEVLVGVSAAVGVDVDGGGGATPGGRG